MVLLGAGASVEAGVPAAVKLTETLIRYFHPHSRTQQVLRYVYGGLMLGKGARGEDPLKGINVEDLVEAIGQLANRKKLQLAPFVALWNEGVTAFQEEDTMDMLTKAFQEIIDITRTSMDGDERRFKSLSFDATLHTLSARQSRDFMFAKESVIKALLHLLWLEDAEKVAYFEPMLRQGKESCFTIATLNYDNTIELACQALDIPFSTGLDQWSAFKGFPPPENGIDLLKLHGSVTWEKKSRRWAEPTAEQPMPFVQVREQTKDSTRRGSEPAVIFGAGNKLTAEGPFLELLMAFRERLEQHEELVVIGYSFADDHINDAIWRWLNRDQARVIRVIDYSDDKSYDPFKNLFHYLEDRYSCMVDGAGAGIKEIWG